ncbi:MAG TPA: hypothetical protein ENK49_06955 [Gammaproteobacteria bacterium]|nr:hypothetical protein [Gammaproteobacteria bacterium]
MTESRNRFFPSVDNGLQARAAIHARLHESLAHIFEQCEGHVTIDWSRADMLLLRTTTGERLPPVLFGHYFRLVQVIENGTMDEVQQAVDTLLNHASDADVVPMRVRPLVRQEFTVEEEADLRREFVSESLHDEQIRHLDDNGLASTLDQFNRSLSILRTHAPQTYGEIDALVCEFVPALGHAWEGMEFDGCSSLERWGTVLINAKLPRTDLQLCEAITHESAHNALFAMAPVNFHVENDPDELYKSPLRLDPRPMNGIYHATFVLARMCFAMREVAASATAGVALQEEALKLARESARLFADGHEVLEKHARYTPEGRRIMQDAARYMSTGAVCNENP